MTEPGNALEPSRARLLAEAAVAGLARVRGVVEVAYESDSGAAGEQLVGVLIADGSRHTLTVSAPE